MKPTLRATLGFAALLALSACTQQVDTPSPAERAARVAKEAQAKEAQAKQAQAKQTPAKQAPAISSSASPLPGYPGSASSKASDTESSDTESSDTESSDTSSAAKPGQPSLDRVKALVQGASRGRTRAVSLFDGPDGLTGVLTIETSSNTKSIIFTNAAGTVVLPQVIGENGENLIEKAMTDQQVYAKPEDILTRAADAAAKPIMFGKSGPVLTVFMDPNCYYCHKLFQDFQGPVKAGKLRIRFIMLGFLKPDSMAKAAAIVAAKDPVAELAKDELQFDEKTESGATVVPATPDPAALDAVTANSRLMAELGPISTPGLLYCSNNKVVFTRGAPPVDTFLPTVSSDGHPACSK